MRKLMLAISALLFAGSGFAATVASVATAKGSVLVNQGKQFVTVQPNQLLAVGDRVMVMEGGSAILNFADGCVKNLDSGSLLLIQNTCESSSLSKVVPTSAQAVGEERDCDDDGLGDSKDDDIDGDGKLNADDTYENCKVGAMIWVAGGVGLAGAAALISDGDDETISP